MKFDEVTWNECDVMSEMWYMMGDEYVRWYVM